MKKNGGAICARELVNSYEYLLSAKETFTEISRALSVLDLTSSNLSDGD
jgi:hypothetical protein